jgi:signal transduction histidine kinase
MSFGVHLPKVLRELWLPLLVTCGGAAAALAVPAPREPQQRIEHSAAASAADAPTARPARHVLAPLPSSVLLGALLLAAGAVVFQLTRSRRRARALSAANRTLDLCMREAREGEASLRRLSEELEQRVRERTGQLEDTLAELEAFNFSVSHDLRSPIGAVLNFVAILEEEHCPQLPPAGRELVARIRGSAERAIELLEGLLKLSRAGRTALEIEDLDMAALAREAFAQARGSDAGEIELEVGPLPRARGDRALLGSVFVNLLGNAVKYTRTREKRRIVVSGTSAEGTHVYAVTDNGIGFDERFAAKLFRVFERLHASDRFEGAGIGLAIVSRIVQRHGGRVWAEGRPDGGASFFFSLPSAAGGVQ